MQFPRITSLPEQAVGVAVPSVDACCKVPRPKPRIADFAMVMICFGILLLFPIGIPNQGLIVAALVTCLAMPSDTALLFVLFATAGIYFPEGGEFGKGVLALTPTRIAASLATLRILLFPGIKGIIQGLRCLHTGLLFFCVLFIAWGPIAYTGGFETVLSVISVTVTTLQFIVIIATLMSSINDLRRVVVVLLLAGMLVSGYQLLVGLGAIQSSKGSVALISSEVVRRSTAARSDPNFESSLVAPIWGVLLILLVSFRKILWRALIFIGLFASIYMVLSSGSRAGVVVMLSSALLAFFFLISARGVNRPIRFIFMVLGAVILFAGTALAFEKQLSGVMLRFFGGETSSRLDQWIPALKHIFRNPLPRPDIYFSMSQGRLAHNIILHMGILVGWLGLIGTAALYTYILILGVYRVRRTWGIDRIFRSCLLIQVIGIILMLMTMGGFGHKLFWGCAVAIALDFPAGPHEDNRLMNRVG